MLETLWIDRPAAEERISKLIADASVLARQLSHFHADGVVIIPGAVAPDVIDRYLVEFSKLVSEDKIKAEVAGSIINAKHADSSRPGTKFLDVHARSELAQQISFAPPLKEFLQALFCEEALAFQTLHFKRGSTQAVHNDTAYVVVNEPKSMVASWVALEDVQPGSGELIYYPGSHRFNDYLYAPDRKHFDSEKDSGSTHDRHLDWIHEQAAAKGISLASFRPKKGDALFWHADLCHGGGVIDDPSKTRESLVTHYCPAHCTPRYFEFLSVENQVKIKSLYGDYISSAQYPLGSPQIAEQSFESRLQAQAEQYELRLYELANSLLNERAANEALRSSICWRARTRLAGLFG